MIESLRVANFVLIDDVEVTFEAGFTAITGETGAGKSLLAGALALVLGARATGELVRPGSKQGSVEATFAYTPRSAMGKAVEAVLGEAGIEAEDGMLIVRRTLSPDGRSRCYVNGTATVLKVVAALGEALVDLHGQHEHQSLLRPAVYLDLLDDHGELGESARAVAEGHARRASLRRDIADLRRDEEERLREIDMLSYQVGEIEAAELDDPQEEEKLDVERNLLRNAEALHGHAATIVEALSEGEGCAADRLGDAGQALAEMAKVDVGLAELAEQLEAARTTVDEVTRAMQRYGDGVDHEPGRLEALEGRLHLFHALKRKYGATLEEVIAYGLKARERLDALENADSRREALQRDLAQAEVDLARHALELHEKRKATGTKLARAVGKRLKDLALPDAVFQIDSRLVEDEDGLPLPRGGRWRIGPRGLDETSFYFAANPGTTPQPLRAVASGGELSRIMLAIKSALAAGSRVPTLVFDEIDVGIGGRTADAVGAALRELGRRYQVLCITHLPQIAAQADRHVTVEKVRESKRARTLVRLLPQDDRSAELARMLGGAEDSEEALQHAQALLRRRT